MVLSGFIGSRVLERVGYFLTTEKVKVKGVRNASVFSDEQITEKLKRGKMSISLMHVDEVKEIVATSTLACEHLIERLK